MADKVSKKIKTIIAKECGIKRDKITDKTNFMGGQKISYFDCMAAMFVLQHQFHVSLPESNYAKYATVGGLTKDIVKQLRHRQK